MGENVVIQDDVVIEDEVKIGNNVVIYPGCFIGHHTLIGDNVVIGKQPTPAPTSTVKIEKPLPPTQIGPYCLIGTSAIIYAGVKIGERTRKPKANREEGLRFLEILNRVRHSLTKRSEGRTPKLSGT
jgi:acetyltransferase-like isoleucine patch superfamily enzyme